MNAKFIHEKLIKVFEQRQLFKQYESIGKTFWVNLLNICKNC